MPKRRRSGNIGRLTRNQRNTRRRTDTDEATENNVHLENSEDRNYQIKFEEELRNLKYYECKNCSRMVMQLNHTDICKKCQDNPEKFTHTNFMDPGTVPDELKDLTYVEQLLIAKVHPVMRVYRVKSRGRPGQYAYSGNIINIGQDITEIVRKLPRTPVSLNIVVIKRDALNGHRDFHVRRNKVIAALIFLKNNNPFYSDIEIDDDQLPQLPLDGSIFDQIPVVEFEDSNGNEDNLSNEVYESLIPNNIRLEEAQKIQSTIDNSIPWPQGTNIINEFNCEGYLSMAFPTLLSRGSAELNDNRRQQKLTVNEYFLYLMQYKDGRFAKDPRFRFFALNTIQRHDAIKKGTIFAKKSHFSGTIEELKGKIADNPQVVRSLSFWCGQIRGTKSYWYQRKSELEAMLNQCGIPTVFLTLSAADLWWPDLARLMGWNFEEEELLNEYQIAERRQKLINENPLIVESYFTERAIFFIDEILCKKFKIFDYWFRFEFQHRGSCHLHGLLWLSGAPNSALFDTASEQEILNAKEYYDNLVSAINPLPSIPPAIVHPSRIRSTDTDIDDERSLSELLNRFQRHTRCTKGYCLKQVKGEYVCRFNYPKQIQQESSLQKNEKGQWTYTPARNDELLNHYNSFISQTWRANTDVSIITSEYMLIKYLAKYASKSEPASKSLSEMFQEIVESRSGADQSRQAYTSLMMKIIGERDIGACETCHLLLGLPLFKCTRNFQMLVIRLEEYVAVNENGNGADSSFIAFYRKRPEEYEEISLFEFAKKYSKRAHNTVSKNRIEKVVQVSPKVDVNSNNNSKELYYKQQLMLHKFWRNETDLKNLNESWHEASIRQNLVDHPQLDTRLNSEDDDEDPENENIEVFDDRDWMAIAEVMPNGLPAPVSLGNRDIDLLNDWSASYQEYPDIKNNLSFIEKTRERMGDQCQHTSSSGVSFNEQQLKILSFLDHQLSTNDECSDKLAIIQGKAGTGKSCVIHEMVTRINAKYVGGATVLMAPTGVAANNINGQTLHSALRIPVNNKINFSPLVGDSKISFEEEFKDLKFVIIDEASMLGLNLFFKVDQRLREAKPQSSHLPFGGLCVYLVGDWSQLPPVCDQSLYNAGKSESSIQASFLYKQFKKVFFLEQIMRQQGEEQKSFRETLERISNGTITEQDYKLLSTRFHTNNIRDNSFKDAVCIMSKNADIDKFNYDKLESLKQPIALINAIHNNSEASNASTDDAQGLFAKLHLCKGARVILRRNLWVAKGLANGSVGTVTDIIYEPYDRSKNYHDRTPLCILVKFDKYTGPTLYNDSIPILPVTSSFKKLTVNCSRRQFPLMLGYAISIHRSQGITLDKAIVNLGDNEFSIGLSYVALSRVKTMAGLLLKPTFNFKRLQKINNSKAMAGRREELLRLAKIASES